MVKERIIGCIRKVWPVALKTSCWFLKIMLPVSFVVMLLTYFQVLPAVSAVVAPLFTRIGLPGDAALVFVTGIFTNIYTVIALLSNMDFTVREGILLAMMCLISHNYPVETLVQKKTGSAGWKMVLLRFTCSFIAAAVLNLILPEFAGRMIAQPSVDLGFRDTLFNWLQTSPDYRIDDPATSVGRIRGIEMDLFAFRSGYAIVGFTPTGGFFMGGGQYAGVGLRFRCIDGLCPAR